MRKLFDWLNLGHHLSGAAHAAIGIVCLGALYAAFVGAADNRAATEERVYAAQNGPQSEFMAASEMISVVASSQTHNLWRASAAAALPKENAGQTNIYGASDLAGADTRLRRVASDLEQERRCLATGIYFEARGETYYGQLAVAEVILNRVASRRYPNTVCGVVFQGAHRRNACQFSFACDGISDRPRDQLSWRKATRLARYATMGVQRQAIIGGATHYHADYVKPHWASAFVEVAKIGRHIFYKKTKSAS